MDQDISHGEWNPYKANQFMNVDKAANYTPFFTCKLALLH
jgi:hypothetical protein